MSLDLAMRRKYLINGFVQGVGFRPFVKRSADRFLLSGFVRNSSIGVEIEVEGNKRNVENFDDTIKNDLPFPATIFDVEQEDIADKHEKEFIILKSNSDENVRAYFPLDLALCDDCQKELYDENNRRFEYPFINCTSCGPRYTIIKNLPYDRPFTTMSEFDMCENCKKEYENSNDRRFHAQPNACSKCGPEIQYIINSNNYYNVEAFEKAVSFLRGGEIIAIKGLGGFHLVCDAKNDIAVQKLREIKNRDKKPLAIMISNFEIACQIVEINKHEKELLISKIAPILLLKSKANKISKYVAPDNKKLGVFLPYTPVHHLLFKYGAPNTLVMTSANDSVEPIISDDQEAVNRCKILNIGLLTNNRKINFRDDDSVIQVVGNDPQLIRGGRGYLPRPIPLSFRVKNSGIALGGDLKNSFAIMLAGEKPLAVMSPYIGDMEHPFAQEVLEKTIEEYSHVFEIKPEFVAIDLHPKYFSSQIGKKIAKKFNAKIITVQHHHAHIASVMAEHKLNTKCIGLALDGTGFGGEDIWGAECMIANFKDFKRVASIKPFTMVGGDKAIREPWRIAIASFIESENYELAKKLFGDDKFEQIKTALNSKIDFIKASSMGRLFDIVATIALSINESNYEAELAVRFEQQYEDLKTKDLYSFEWKNDDLPRIDFSKLIVEVAKDKLKGVSINEISYKFHQTLAKAMIEMINVANYDIPIVLSGGCFQNTVLYSLIKKRLENLSRKVYSNRLLPVNDQSIALGQIAIASNGYEL